MAKVTIEGNTFINVGTAVTYSLDSDSIIDFKNNNLHGVKTAIEERDPPGFVQTLGLPADTPIADILDVVREIREKRVATSDAASGVEFLKQSKLWPYIERSANIVTVISGLFAFAAASMGIPTAL